MAARHAAVPRPPPGAGPRRAGSDVAVTGRTRTGRLDTDVVPPSRCEEAVQAAAVPGPPPGPAPQQGFSVVVTEQAPAGRVYSDIVQAGSAEEAVQVAAAQAAPRAAAWSRAAGRGRRPDGCADVWVYALLHCELGAGHDPPHLAIAHGYRRPVRWVRDDRGIAHPVPDPARQALPWFPRPRSHRRPRKQTLPRRSPPSKAHRGGQGHHGRPARPDPRQPGISPGRIRGGLNGAAEPAAPGQGALGLRWSRPAARAALPRWPDRPDRHTEGVTYEQEWTLTLTAAQLHAHPRACPPATRRSRHRQARTVT